MSSRVMLGNKIAFEQGQEAERKRILKAVGELKPLSSYSYLQGFAWLQAITDVIDAIGQKPYRTEDESC